MATTQTSAPTPIEGSYRTMARGFAALDLHGLGLGEQCAGQSLQQRKFRLGLLLLQPHHPRCRPADRYNAASKRQIVPLGAFYRDVVIPNWGFFGIFLTLAELAVAIGLLFGIATRLAAVGGLLLLTPIWVMLWHTDLYLWEYPLDLFPLLLLAIVPAGRVFGADRSLAPRFRGRWPF
jgi:uncharacterized membrane protein YphA (DoxX/SURF4 family)